jgi:ParB-like chromosome segregation protein Spo0J
MLKTLRVSISEIYVPKGRRNTLEIKKAADLAEDILENGQQVPIQVRQGKGRFVLVEGLHRLEACILLGEEEIPAYLVQARKF